jgi:hypothetical protein
MYCAFESIDIPSSLCAVAACDTDVRGCAFILVEQFLGEGRVMAPASN